jgi:hypothetical protein
MSRGADVSTADHIEQLEGDGNRPHLHGGFPSAPPSRRNCSWSARVKATPAPVCISSVSDGVCKRASVKYGLALLTEAILNVSARYATIISTPHALLTTLEHVSARSRQPLRDNAV